MLQKLKTIVLDGCNLGKSQMEIRDTGSSEILKANKKASSSAVLVRIPRDSKFFVISLPRSLVSLSLANNNLSTESFPMDLSCLSMLKRLYLDKNPIVSMPNCVRSLPRLETLTMRDCEMLTSVEHPPLTLRELHLYCSYGSDRSLLRKVEFDPEMSPLVFSVMISSFTTSSFEIQGMIKIQSMGGVEEKVLRCLGWTDLHFLKERRLETDIFPSTREREREESEIQMYYEFGIHSTVYGGEEMPNWITERSKDPSISFTIPSSPKQLRGLNFCYLRMPLEDHEFQRLPIITVSNLTKNHTWMYSHYIEKAHVGGDCVIMLSHWVLGMNEMEAGDQVTIIITHSIGMKEKMCWVTKECGVSFVYDDLNEEEDALGYYKSWNHIIGDRSLRISNNNRRIHLRKMAISASS